MNPNHLVLLMGTNPLPNYVAAKYFLALENNLNNICVLCSKETYPPAERLEKILKAEYPQLKYEYCDLRDPGDAIKIQDDIQTKFVPNIHPDDVIHLNYTGGTKSMGVHTYLTLFQKIEKRKISYSYLDAHDFKLKFDDGSITEDLRESITIEFDKLLKLHDCRQKSIASSIDYSAANELMAEYVQKGKIKIFLDWKDKVIRYYFYQTDRLQKPNRPFLKDYMQVDQRGNVFSFYSEALRLVNSLPENQRWIFDAQQQLIIPDTEKEFREEEGQFVKGIKYLDGTWFEYYVGEALNNAKDNDDFKLLNNWHIVKGPERNAVKDLQGKVVKGPEEKEFEIDIMILYGYQLCGISITSTSKEFICKSKAFEILHRSQQMGGEEARSVLITTMDTNKVEKMERDLAIDIGGSKQFLILGIDDLPQEKMWEKIKNHILGE